MIIHDNPQTQVLNVDTGAVAIDANNLPEQLQTNLGEDLWDMWQQAGLEPINWPSLLDDIHEG